MAYDGTDYFGWQVQPGVPTIQGVLSQAVREITGDTLLPQGASRTDTGVHAEGQVVSLVLRAAIPAERLHRALNRRLPAAIRVITLDAVAPEFHPRAEVLHKTYEYRIFERRRRGDPEERICPPHAARFVWDCRWPLQVERMRCAAAALLGTHDFTSFAAYDPDRARRLAQEGVSNVRTIIASEWEHLKGWLVYRVTGNGFLHHMVRTMVGTCVEAGTGRLSPDSIPAILAGRNRRLAAATAPARGLHLMQVTYKPKASAQDVSTLAAVHQADAVPT